MRRALKYAGVFVVGFDVGAFVAEWLRSGKPIRRFISGRN